VEASDDPEVATAATEADLKATAEDLISKIGATFLATVPAMVRDEVIAASRTIEIKVAAAAKVKVDLAHKLLPDVTAWVSNGIWPFLVGPAGSGKTTLAKQVAKVLKRKFYAENRVTSEYKLLGFVDGHGRYVRTQFREAYEKGGGFLLDEVDASDADALVSFNAALENGFCAFPDKLVPMHKDFFCIAAGNTFGRGADRQYVGRNQLDAATLDRFAILEMDYDEDFELQLAGNAEWTRYVQKVRSAVEAEKIRHIVSPRASIKGAIMLAAGMAQSKVEEALVWKGLDAGNRGRVMTRLGAMA
jgi:cobaltochelatase CobS